MPAMHPAIELIADEDEHDTEALAQAPVAQLGPPPAALCIDGRMVPIAASGAVVSVSCEVRLDLPSVSRRHAWIRPANGSWAVHDLDSTNGVALNGAMLDSPQWLRHGDALQIGRAQVTFVAGLQSDLAA